jgi:hypothetical protein
MACVRQPPVSRTTVYLVRVSQSSGRPADRDVGPTPGEITFMGSVIKKRRKRMAKKKHRKLLRKTRVARRKAGK